ncbi:hypothetical protein H5410_014898 [Solanum commersonii]|uniref:Uncharacterized protein n=1 Tax=Solanum commersonii TaxID=4109 RepID=A0A9J5ZSR9_SOLCO|nr:hypothetical protein H5410_014898 [Solanum commersonii]
MIIKKIIVPEEWGMSTLKELDIYPPRAEGILPIGFASGGLYMEENIFFEGISLIYFFIEFSIPWITKWSIESKLLQKNPEGKLHGQEIIDLINVKISKYYDTVTMEPQVMEDLSQFKKNTRKLQMKKGLISKSEAVAIYMEEVKKDLMKNLDLDIKDDISLASASHTNEEDDTCIAGEGQDVDEEEIDIETILKRYQQQLEESSSTSTTDKGKEKV